VDVGLSRVLCVVLLQKRDWLGGGGDVLRARKRSSDRTAIAFRRRTPTALLLLVRGD